MHHFIKIYRSNKRIIIIIITWMKFTFVTKIFCFSNFDITAGGSNMSCSKTIPVGQTYQAYPALPKVSSTWSSSGGQTSVASKQTYHHRSLLLSDKTNFLVIFWEKISTFEVIFLKSSTFDFHSQLKRINFFSTSPVREMATTPPWCPHWCRFMCRARWSEREKLRSQWTHLNGFTPVCFRWCRVSSSERAKRHSQPSQEQR